MIYICGLGVFSPGRLILSSRSNTIQLNMSGHSKWSKIKRQKGKEDQKRGQLFSKLAKAIRIAVVSAKNTDPSQSPALRLAIEKARAANMPKVNIDRAVSAASSKMDGVNAINFEGYGPEGVAVIVETTTDNKSRTTAEIRNLFERNGGSLGGPGSAAFMFSSQNGKLVANSKIPLDESKAKIFTKFVAKLTEHDDVDRVVHTAKLIVEKND